MRRLAVAIGAVAVLAFVGAALAQTTGDERIYACVNNGDGAMKQVAGADAVCSKGWHQISWSAENAPAEDTTTYVKQRTVAIPDNVVAVSAAARCNDEDVATGGGTKAGTSGLEIVDSRPADVPGTDAGLVFDNDGWEATGRKDTGAGQQQFVGIFFVYVVCQHTE